MLEKTFQAGLIKDLRQLFPGCIILKNDANYLQGVPDILILYRDRWAALENKKSSRAKKQPNQDYYIESMNQMSFASFISPENKEEILDALQQSLEPTRPARISER